MIDFSLVDSSKRVEKCVSSFTPCIVINCWLQCGPNKDAALVYRALSRILPRQINKK